MLRRLPPRKPPEYDASLWDYAKKDYEKEIDVLCKLDSESALLSQS